MENVITDEQYRKRGLATQCLNYAKELAMKNKCYKLMLLTGSKQDSTLKFYEQRDITEMIRRLLSNGYKSESNR